MGSNTKPRIGVSGCGGGGSGMMMTMTTTMMMTTTTTTSAPTKGDTADGDKPSQDERGRGLILSTEPEQHNCKDGQ